MPTLLLSLVTFRLRLQDVLYLCDSDDSSNVVWLVGRQIIILIRFKIRFFWILNHYNDVVFSHFPLIPTKRTLEVIEPAEKDTISNESENSRPKKENQQNSDDLVMDQSILRENSPLPSNSTDSKSISDTSATCC